MRRRQLQTKRREIFARQYARRFLGPRGDLFNWETNQRKKEEEHTVKHSRSVKILGMAFLLFVLGITPQVFSQGAPASLEDGFRNPPASAKPRVWWHWMNGNITKEGIRLDLEWMKRVGIGGFQNFDAALHTPKLVDKRLVYMTPEWKEAFKYATTLADQLGGIFEGLLPFWRHVHQALDVHDARMEGGLQICHHACRPAWPRR